MSNYLRTGDGVGGTFVVKSIEQSAGVQTPVVQIDSFQKQWQENFADPTLAKWDVTSTLGATVVAGAAALTISTGTTAGATVEMLSKETFTIPFRVLFGVTNTRIAGVHHLLEAVSIDPMTGLLDGKNALYWQIGGVYSTGQTNAHYGVQSSGLRALESANVTIATTASLTGLELEPFCDESYFHSRGIDSSSARINSYVRHQQIPDPNATYKLRIRTINAGIWTNITGAIAGAGGVIRLTSTAHGLSTNNVIYATQLAGVTNAGADVRGLFTVTAIDANTLDLQGTTFGGAYVQGSGRYALAAAPATSTLTINFISVSDYSELTTEITGGRGQNAVSQSLGVNVTGGVSTTSNLDNVFYNETTTAQAANAVLTGTARDTGIASAALTLRYAKFNAFAFADQAGTMQIQVSNDNTTWRAATAAIAVAINTPIILTVPVMTRYYRAVYTNGAILQTAFMLNTSYTVS